MLLNRNIVFCCAECKKKNTTFENIYSRIVFLHIQIFAVIHAEKKISDFKRMQKKVQEGAEMLCNFLCHLSEQSQ